MEKGRAAIGALLGVARAIEKTARRIMVAVVREEWRERDLLLWFDSEVAPKRASLLARSADECPRLQGPQSFKPHQSRCLH